MLSLYEAQMSALAILSQPRKRSVVQISESRPGHFASICRHCPRFAKLILRCWFATVVVMSERSPDQIREQIRELLDSLYRVDSGRILATLIRLLGDFDLAEEAMHEAFAAALSLWPQSGVPGNPRPWLISTARFKAIDTLRRHRRVRFDASEDAHYTAKPRGWKDSCSLILLRAFTPLRNVPKDSGRIDYICDAKSPGLHRRSLGRWHTKLL